MRWDRRLFGGLVLASAVAGFAASCSDITPEPNDEGGGVLQSPTDEADQMRQQEEQQEERTNGWAGAEVEARAGSTVADAA